MRTEAFLTALREMAAAVPFAPFVVELTNGQSWLIDHPEAVRVENGVAIYIEAKKPHESTSYMFDGEAVFRLKRTDRIIDPGIIVDPPDEPF